MENERFMRMPDGSFTAKPDCGGCFGTQVAEHCMSQY
jgi:hypothetical protein